MEGRWLRHDWPDGAVVYDRLTGDTHALDALAAALLDLPVGVRHDAQAAAQSLDPAATSADEAWQDRVQTAFDHLRRLELI